MKNFVSVSTNAARYQDISLNPQKLAGLCAKLKCCLNYEVDDYVEAGRKLPSRAITLFTQDSEYFLLKPDILAGLITYSTQKGVAANLETITAERAKEIIEQNRRGEKPETLAENGDMKDANTHTDLLADADLSRFDKTKKKHKSKSKNKVREQRSADNAAPETAPAAADKGERQERQRHNNQQRGKNRQTRNGRPARQQDGNAHQQSNQ